ncbi:MAG TPA: hypothetical protein PLM48_07800 [Clostridia bacterium]|nr:hypothetical protein [Clostridia bacterium]
MRRTTLLLLCCLLAVMSVTGCVSGDNVYEHKCFTADLPDGFERTNEDGIVCFAPNGSAARQSSITFSITEKNYYFDELTREDYIDYVTEYLGYDECELVEFSSVRVDGYKAHRVLYSVALDQGEHSLCLYAVDADKAYFFVLLEREEDDCMGEFDHMMDTIELHGVD